MNARTSVIALALLAFGGCSEIASKFDRRYNVVNQDPWIVSDAPVPGTHGLFVADLHADTLMWHRDVLKPNSQGHVDLPRLRDGGVSLQVFTVVTRTLMEWDVGGDPPSHCIPTNGLNTTALLSVVQNRPVGTWFNLQARAWDQADELEDAVRRSQVAEAAGKGAGLLWIKSAVDLKDLVAATAVGRPVVGTVLGIEGVHWLTDPNDTAATQRAIDELYGAGFRQVAPTHRFDNSLAGASEGCTKYGLTTAGRAFLSRAEQVGMVVDLAHASRPALLEALTGDPEGRPGGTPVLREPVVISHTGVQAGCGAPCYKPRNLDDDEIRAVARNGGVIGVGYWPEAVGEGHLSAVVNVMMHIRAVLSQPSFASEMAQRRPGWMPADHIALGSDFDGTVTTPIDASQVPWLLRFMEAGREPGQPAPFSPEETRRIAGANVCRVFRQRLRREGDPALPDFCATSSPLTTTISAYPK